ncbi:MAG: helix-hairpin-helix domain-containing protein [Firmicutes bacterium]|nr:helix-hairpin-helix domain-containing protein [Bacillota bacterium]
MNKSELMQIPGVGKRMAEHMTKAGYPTIESLKGANPDEIYAKSVMAGMMDDRCALYLYRLCVAYANNEIKTPEQLKWYNWKD